MSSPPHYSKFTRTIQNELSDYFKWKLQFDDVVITMDSGSGHGVNFIGIVYCVKGRVPSASIQNVEHLFLKVAPNNSIRRERFHVRENFLREILVYNEILPYFRRIQLANEIDNVFTAHCVCYRTINTELSESLFLEDLRQHEFEMLDHRTEDISFEHARLVMSALGRFHALSFAAKNKFPNEFAKFVRQMTEVFLCRSDEFMLEFLEDLKPKILGSLDSIRDAAIVSKLATIFSESHFDIASRCVDGAGAEPYAVICHGDCWNNNILFKHDKNRRPVEMKFVDWQLARYASPVTDILQFLFCSTTRELRGEFLDELLRVYYGDLAEMISSFNLDPAEIFPFDALQQQLRQYGIFGVSIASTLLPMLTSDEDSCPDLDTLASDIQTHRKDQNPFDTETSRAKFNERMRDVIVDVDRFGYI